MWLLPRRLVLLAQETIHIQSENMQSVCFTRNMLREHGKVQGLPTA